MLAANNRVFDLSFSSISLVTSLTRLSLADNHLGARPSSSHPERINKHKRQNKIKDEGRGEEVFPSLENFCKELSGLTSLTSISLDRNNIHILPRVFWECLPTSLTELSIANNQKMVWELPQDENPASSTGGGTKEKILAIAKADEESPTAGLSRLKNLRIFNINNDKKLKQLPLELLCIGDSARSQLVEVHASHCGLGKPASASTSGGGGDKDESTENDDGGSEPANGGTGGGGPSEDALPTTSSASSLSGTSRYGTIRANALLAHGKRLGLRNLTEKRANQSPLTPPPLTKWGIYLQRLTATNSYWHFVDSMSVPLTSLRFLDLANNYFETIPEGIFDCLPNLRVLHFEANLLKEISPKIRQLLKLRMLYLQDNVLQLLPPQIGCLTRLSCLDISGNRLSTLPAQLGLLKLDQLKVVRDEKGLRPSPPPRSPSLLTTAFHLSPTI